MSEVEIPVVDVPVPKVPAPIAEVSIEEPGDKVLTQEQQLELAQNALRSALAEVGVTAEHLAAWKDRYGRVAAFPIYEQLYVVRPLNRKEWRLFMKEQATTPNQPNGDEDLEEKIAAVATIFPQLNISILRSDEHAGIATALARSIEMISGFTPGTMPIVL